MNRAQEASLALMILMPLGALITGSVAVLLVYTQGTHFLPLLMFTLALVLGSLFWIVPAVVQKIHKRKKVVSDERDKLILARTVSYAWTTFWWVLFAACFLLFSLIGPQNSVPALALPLIAFGGGMVHKITTSVAILVQYGRGGRDE